MEKRRDPESYYCAHTPKVDTCRPVPAQYPEGLIVLTLTDVNPNPISRFLTFRTIGPSDSGGHTVGRVF